MDGDAVYQLTTYTGLLLTDLTSLQADVEENKLIFFEVFLWIPSILSITN